MSTVTTTPAPTHVQDRNDYPRHILKEQGYELTHGLPGPSRSRIEVWLKPELGKLVLLQFHADGRGWEYFLQGKEVECARVKDDIIEFSRPPAPKVDPAKLPWEEKKRLLAESLSGFLDLADSVGDLGPEDLEKELHRYYQKGIDLKQALEWTITT